MNKIALFDLDGTLADYEGQLLADLEKLRSDGESLYSLHKDHPSWYSSRIKLIRSIPGWWSGLPIFSLGMDILREATRIGFHIQILTKGPKGTTGAWTEKVQWCYEKLGIFNITIASASEADYHKGLVYGRVLVDDFPEYIQAWLKWRKNGVVIMPANSGNEGFAHSNVVRYDGNNLGEVIERLVWAYER